MRKRVAVLPGLGLAGAIVLSSCGSTAVQTAKPVAKVSASASTASPSATPAQATSPPRNQFQAGVTILAYESNPSLIQKSRPLLDHLAGLHVNSVSLAILIYQSGWSSTDVRADPVKTPSPALIAAFAHEAHSRGMSVLLRPLFDDGPFMRAGPQYWRGTLQPSNRATWYRNYDALMMTYARAAQDAGIEVLDVGTELGTLQTDTQPWLDLIGSIRQVFTGQLTYSINWGQPYPAFATGLDFISVDAFYPLSAPSGASVSQLVSAWQKWVSQLSQYQASWNKPLVLTELGVTSERGSFQAPYTWRHNTGVSLQDQQRYYAATCQALKPMLSGMYWWAYDFNGLPAPARDTGYNPMGKPAEQEIAKCYS